MCAVKRLQQRRVCWVFHFLDSRSKTACPEFEPLCPCQNKRPPFGGLLFSYGDPQRRACFSSEKRMGGAVRTPEPFCAPATGKALKPLGFRAFPLRFQGERTVCFAAFRCAKTGAFSHPTATVCNDSVCYIIKIASIFNGDLQFKYFVCYS